MSPLKKPPRKQRLDQLLVDRGLAESRTRAQALILAGLVYSGEQRLEKPGQNLDAAASLEVRGRDHPWVSRGGVKLAHGLEHFAISVQGNICLDLGASTGGFTDVLLAHGAVKVFAVDVGQGQLDWKLRNHPRVVVLEKTNARYLSETDVPTLVDMIVCDASFIGLETLLPEPLKLAAPGCRLIALIKPQFEVGRENLPRGGVVRDPSLHDSVCRRVEAWLGALPGWRVIGVTPSPLLGPKGNREFLIAARHV